MLFELGQLIVGERYLGIKQIEAGDEVRENGPGEFMAFLWSTGIVVYWLWMVLMLHQTLGVPQVFTMIGVSLIGLFVRRGCPLKWVLVVLTFEGALRIGMLLSLCGLAWRHL